MKNGDMPAMPIIDAEGRCSLFGNENLSASGLTKREMFAMAAMQGLLACCSNVTTISAVNMAVECADLLLRRLDGEDINPPIIPNPDCPDWPEPYGGE